MRKKFGGKSSQIEEKLDRVFIKRKRKVRGKLIRNNLKSALRNLNSLTKLRLKKIERSRIETLQSLKEIWRMQRKGNMK